MIAARQRSSSHQSKTMRFVDMDCPTMPEASPCMVPISHRLNQDGYLYKTWTAEGSNTKTKEAFHRFIFRAHNGEDAIPEGYEIDHICHNRACCNHRHLRPIERSDHKRVTNTMRYAGRLEEARCHWEATGCTGTALADRFGVTISCGCRWIRLWLADPSS